MAERPSLTTSPNCFLILKLITTKCKVQRYPRRSYSASASRSSFEADGPHLTKRDQAFDSFGKKDTFGMRLLDCHVCRLSLPFPPPFQFLRVVPKQTADTLLHRNIQLISCCTCILTSNKSWTQFSVIFCSVQFHFKGPPGLYHY